MADTQKLPEESAFTVQSVAGGQDAQQEPRALADAYVAAIWYSAMRAYDHDGIGERDDDAAIADLAQSINALRHPTSDAASEAQLLAKLGSDEMVEAVQDCGPIGCCSINDKSAREILSTVSDALKEK